MLRLSGVVWCNKAKKRWTEEKRVNKQHIQKGNLRLEQRMLKHNLAIVQYA